MEDYSPDSVHVRIPLFRLKTIRRKVKPNTHHQKKAGVRRTFRLDTHADTVTTTYDGPFGRGHAHLTHEAAEGFARAAEPRVRYSG